MAGIYVHIPFCKSRCVYCDFFSTTLLELRDEYVKALLKEMQLRRNYLTEGTIRTVYFGGGTPSMLSAEQIGTILEGLRAQYCIAADAELTLEANPSDISEEKLRSWREMGFDRLSIGVQSFRDAALRTIGRRHNAQQAKEAVRKAQKEGFENVSIDLIYGLPSESLADWKDEVRQALELNIQHVSAYCLSYEEGTELTRMREREEVKEVDEETENAMYDYLVEALHAAGIERYEVSNFAKQGRESQHNSNYWNGTSYLGLGAGAHSFDGKSRQWNVCDLEAYLRGIESETAFFEREELTATDMYNEQVMLGLRTRNGLQLSAVGETYRSHCTEMAKAYIERGLLREQAGRLVATQEGIHILNRIIEDMMI